MELSYEEIYHIWCQLYLDIKAKAKYIRQHERDYGLEDGELDYLIFEEETMDKNQEWIDNCNESLDFQGSNLYLEAIYEENIEGQEIERFSLQCEDKVKTKKYFDFMYESMANDIIEMLWKNGYKDKLIKIQDIGQYELPKNHLYIIISIFNYGR